MEKGICHNSKDQNQNDGEIKLHTPKGSTDEDQAKCLKACQKYPGSTGCQFSWKNSDYNCKVHTKDVAMGSGGNDRLCWIFSKCGPGNFQFL